MIINNNLIKVVDPCRNCRKNSMVRFSGNGAVNIYRGLCRDCIDELKLGKAISDAGKSLEYSYDN